MQREASCEQQERQIRDGLRAKGISTEDAVVLADKAESATKDSRPEFDRLWEMLNDGEVGIVAVDDTSRFSRGINAQAMVHRIVFNDARFISVGENIDTEVPGWELLVGVMELHNAASNRERARQVRRGAEDRFLADLSAGSFPLGYKSVYVDKDWLEQLEEGKRPSKRLDVDEGAAETVRLIFQMYGIERMSMNGISRILNGRKVPKSRQSKSPVWTYHNIRIILENEKYVGVWKWGKREIVRDARGNKRQRPSKKPAHQQERPRLQIVEPELWATVQRLRREEVDAARKGMRLDEQPLPPRHRYPTHNLGGLITCGKCGRRLYLDSTSGTTIEGRKTYQFFICPNARDGGNCDQRVRANREGVERALFEFLADFCREWPDWFDEVKSAMHAELQAVAKSAPNLIETLKRRQEKVQQQIKNLVEQMVEGQGSRAIRSRLDELEAEETDLVEQLKEHRSSAPTKIRFPSDQWIRDRLEALCDQLREPSQVVAATLKEIFSKVAVTWCKKPCRSRPHIQLQIQMNPTGMLAVALGEEWRQRVARWTTGLSDQLVEPPELLIDASPPGKEQEWAPTIARLRDEEGLIWKEVAKRVPFTSEGQLIRIYRRWKEFHEAA